ncbi:hypothetical protein C8R47DRAFT_1083249 [Mycena vitilis]|nr:hypothetical protein C8R47DRAFT_1083240 [Mycena vitilis]KAJ6454015.1 hypothetical protein C8R47DRAFT_1083249 [Mycena vitilis]
MFIGSVAARAVGQTAHDIYLTDHWGAQLPQLRHESICIAPGIVFNGVQRDTMGPAGWQISWPGALTVTYTERGTIYTPLPPAALPQQLLFSGNGLVGVGHVLTWLDEVDERRVVAAYNPPRRLHYHEHAARAPFQLQAPPILPQAIGKHEDFSQIHFGSQIQSYRAGSA